MAKCPKCRRHLKLTDISQICPGCGVNLCTYGFEERFYKEAKIAELSQAGLSCKIKRLKAAFIGSKLTITRLVLMLLPVASLVLPTGSATVDVPFKTSDLPFGLLGIYGAFTNGDLSFIGSLASGGAESAVFSALQIGLFALVGVALFGIFVFLTTLFCFASVKNMQKVICTVSALGMAGSIAAYVLIRRFISLTAGSAVVTAKGGFGLFLTFIMFSAVFAVNLMIEKKGLNIEYDEGTVERSEIWLKVKAGEIKIDDLPYPVVETEETRKIQAEIQAEKDAYKENTEELSRAGGKADGE